MKILDLYCCGGGAAKGLMSLGHEVTGIDIDDHSRWYPGTFIQDDVTKMVNADLDGFDFVWASPPCQAYSVGTWQNYRLEGGTLTLLATHHPDLIPFTRELLTSWDGPWCIENVPPAPLRPDLMLCGSMFGLRLVRHRIFELSGFVVPFPGEKCDHSDYITVAGKAGGSSSRDGDDHFGSTQEWREAMGIDWLPGRLLKEAVPPAYSHYIGSFL